MRTAIYVDGFNFYYRALKGTPYRWVDLLALSKQLVRPENEITLIRYFTARVKPYSSNPDQHVRQNSYLEAIKAQIPCLEIHEGQFYVSKTRMPIASPVPGGPRTIEVIKTEEKGSDCNLAAHLVHDACRSTFDVALVISNDSDLAEAIRLARLTGKPVGVANPTADTSKKMNFELYNAASFRRRIEAKHLKAAQMPDQVGEICKPHDW
ncbi:NYN domain-containing protein [Xanthomonas arboricola]|uniref:NYN domain-containing protein n=1 Tax=Xanthomonas arboricola TaxID=56448 RepID=UPI003EB6B158